MLIYIYLFLLFILLLFLYKSLNKDKMNILGCFLCYTNIVLLFYKINDKFNFYLNLDFFGNVINQKPKRNVNIFRYYKLVDFLMNF